MRAGRVALESLFAIRAELNGARFLVVQLCDNAMTGFSLVHTLKFRFSYNRRLVGNIVFILQCVDQLAAYFDSTRQQSKRVMTLQRALNDVASRCAELGAAKTALIKRAQQFELELVGAGEKLKATKEALAVCDREREDAQDEVVRLTDIAALQQEQTVALQAKHDAAQAELARMRSELDAERAAKTELSDSVRTLTESLETERANVESARQQTASVSAELTEATELQHELESSLMQCINQRDRTLQMLQQEQAVVAELQRLNSLTAVAISTTASTTTPSSTVTPTPRLAIPARPAFKRQRVQVSARSAAAPSPASQSAIDSRQRTANASQSEQLSPSASNSSASSSGAIRVLLLP